MHNAMFVSTHGIWRNTWLHIMKYHNLMGKVITCLRITLWQITVLIPIYDNGSWKWMEWVDNVNTLGPRQDGSHFADDIFTCIFFIENCCILIKFSLKYVRRGPIDNNPALVQIVAWRRSGDKPLSEPIVVLFTDAYMGHSASMS